MSKAFARIGFVVPLALAVMLSFGERAAAAEPLPALGADESRTSVSGLSSGAYMAGQFQIAYSKLVIGAGLVAGGPYGCASRHNFYYDWVSATATLEKRNLGWALVHCMQDGRFPTDGTLMLGVPGAASLAAQIRNLAAKGRIDDLTGVASDRIYLFSSANDDTVRLPIMELAEAFYEAIGVPKANIAFVKHGKAPHAFVTEARGPACGERDEAYITDCDYNQAKAILETFYGPSEERSDPPGGQLLTFDQKPFRGGSESGMADDGVVYVPQSCADRNACAVHVVFHGCKQDSETIHKRFIDESGFVPLAAAKGIVLLFPRIKAGGNNKEGCWDWWGYSSDRFLERDAPQMAAVRKMIARLTAPRS